jgi:hypothetical protein
MEMEPLMCVPNATCQMPKSSDCNEGCSMQSGSQYVSVLQIFIGCHFGGAVSECLSSTRTKKLYGCTVSCLHTGSFALLGFFSALLKRCRILLSAISPDFASMVTSNTYISSEGPKIQFSATAMVGIENTQLPIGGSVISLILRFFVPRCLKLESLNASTCALAGYRMCAPSKLDFKMVCRHAEPAFPGQLAAFWRSLVDGALMSSSHERKAVGLQLFCVLLPHISAADVPTVFSGTFMTTVANSLRDRNAYLHKSASRCIDRLVAWAEQPPATVGRGVL